MGLGSTLPIDAVTASSDRSGEQQRARVSRSRRGPPRPVREPRSSSARPVRAAGVPTTAAAAMPAPPRHWRRRRLRRGADRRGLQQQPAVQRRRRRVSESDSAAYGLPSGPRSPMRLGRAARSIHVEASRYQRAAVGISTNRSAATVGAQKLPAPSSGFGVGHADGDQSRGRGDLKDQPEAVLVDAGRLGEPLGLADPESAVAEFGHRCGGQGLQNHLDLAQDVDGGPAAAASTSVAFIVVTTGSGGSTAGARLWPRITWPTSRGRITVSSST